LLALSEQKTSANQGSSQDKGKLSIIRVVDKIKADTVTEGRDRDHMVVGFTNSCAISGYHHLSCEIEACSWQGVLDTTLCDKVC
jgi:hypothetical protein